MISVWNSCAILQIVGRAERLLAQIVKRKPRDAHRRLRHVHVAALHREVAAARRLSRRSAGARLVERGVGLVVSRHMPDRRAGELFQPEIGARIEPHAPPCASRAAR